MPRRISKRTIERNHRIARLLVEAAMTTPEAACERHKVAMRTYYRYQGIIQSGQSPAALEVAETIRQKMEYLDGDFEKSVKRAINGLALYALRCSDEMPADHRGLRASAGFIKLGQNSLERTALLKARIQNCLTGEPLLKAVKAPAS